MVNDFAASRFMHTHYHTQFDSDANYEEHTYRFHHELYGALLLALDYCAVPPLDFSTRLFALKDSLKTPDESLCSALDTALMHAQALWQQICLLNQTYLDLRNAGQQQAADQLLAASSPLADTLLKSFRSCEDHLTRLSWHDDVIFPHEYAQENLFHLTAAQQYLQNNRPTDALSHLTQIDVNRYALAFDTKTCQHFVDYVLHQPQERLMWGAGRILGICELFDSVKALQKGLENTEISAQKAISAQISAQTGLLDAAHTLEKETCLLLSEKLMTMQEQIPQKSK